MDFYVDSRSLRTIYLFRAQTKTLLCLPGGSTICSRGFEILDDFWSTINISESTCSPPWSATSRGGGAYAPRTRTICNLKERS